jgi:hypothetical protein
MLISNEISYSFGFYMLMKAQIFEKAIWFYFYGLLLFYFSVFSLFFIEFPIIIEIITISIVIMTRTISEFKSRFVMVDVIPFITINRINIFS